MKPRTRQHGFTLIELLVVIAIIALLVGILLPSLSNARESARRTACATHLHDMSTALYTYAKEYDDTFPKYGTAGANASASGFNTTQRGTAGLTPSQLASNFQDNLTAALWILVRTESSLPKQFVCPSTEDQADDLKDSSGQTWLPGETWDFKSAKNLSYSSMNMYDVAVDSNWSPNAPAGWVLMSDSNNATGNNVHTSYEGQTGVSQDEINRLENSKNHGGEGQNFLFSDGSTAFEQNPYVGRAADNAYAVNAGTRQSPDNSTPSSSNSEIEPANRAVDSAMIPVLLLERGNTAG